MISLTRKVGLSAERSWTRRMLLKLGGMGIARLGIPNAVKASATRTTSGKPTIRACILVFQYGGPSHLDTFDMKPSAPSEIRGEFKPISTSVPGLSVCEHLPMLSRLMHKIAIIRSVHHTNRNHDPACIEALTGRPAPTGDRELFAPVAQFFPSYGGALSYLLRERGLDVTHAGLPFVFHNVVDIPCQGGGFLGASHDPFEIEVDVQARAYRAELLAAPAGIGPARVTSRRELLGCIETPRRIESIAMTEYYAKAFKLFDSAPIRRALDVGLEDPRVREKYGFDSPPASVGEGGGGSNGAELGVHREMRGQNLLLARRLVEAGVPFVSVYDFKQQGNNWDAHFKVFNQHKSHLLPAADRSLSALIEDLDARGLLESTLVVAMGEFGRTPRINKDGGRDHWPDCYSALLAGGGVRGGCYFGSSDKIGAYPATDPVSPGDLAATIFDRFGFDPATEIRDRTDRPHRLAVGEPIRALFS